MAALTPGTRLGNYRILQPIGAGGMGSVYRAMHESLDRVVAIKTLTSGYEADASFQERFRQEARTVARLKHPNIVGVYDFGEQDGITYIVSEYIDGGTLALRLEAPVRLEYAASVLAQIAAGLDYAHRQGVLHRDIKPANILIEAEDDRAVIADFGLAKIMEAEGGLTRAGMVLGTPEYMAPEQAMGSPVDARADVYSLGVIAYQMAVGRVPFSSTSPLSTILALVNDPLPMPRSLNPSVSERVEQVLCKALAKAPDERYASAGELAQAFKEAVLADGGLLPASGPYSAPSWVARVPTAAEPVGSLPTVTAAPLATGPASSGRVAVATPRRGRSRWLVGALIAAAVAVISVGAVVAMAMSSGGSRGTNAQPTPSNLAPGGALPPAMMVPPTRTSVSTVPEAPSPTQNVIEVATVPDTPTLEPAEEPTPVPTATSMPTPVPPPPTPTRPPPTVAPPRPTATSPPPAPTQPPPTPEPTTPPVLVEPMGGASTGGTSPTSTGVQVGPMGSETSPGSNPAGAAPTPVPVVQPPDGAPAICMGCPVPTPTPS